MIDFIKQFFSGNDEKPSNGKEDRSHDIRIATCALFLEMATIDGEFSDSEKESILSIFEKDYKISIENISELIESARQELEGSVDLWQFTNLINHNYSLDEKLDIMEMVWKVAYADGNLDCHEDYLIHKIANLLRLNHKQLIDAKLKVLNKFRGKGNQRKIGPIP